MLGSPGVAAQLAPSQEGLNSISKKVSMPELPSFEWLELQNWSETISTSVSLTLNLIKILPTFYDICKNVQL
jgi:hypothetical protein